MGFDIDTLRRAVAEHGRVVRVVVAEVRGSSPREVGAAMLVWDGLEGGGQSGTIGGGTLEFEAARAARAQVRDRVLSQHALGPEMGQCCGGAVSLLSEVYDAERVQALTRAVIARPVGAPFSVTENGPENSKFSGAPLAVRRLLAQARGAGAAPEARLVDGWMVEPVHRPARQLWIWGAGHVGRALVRVLSPLPEIEITWVDTAPERFPRDVPEGVIVVPTANPADLVAHAPEQADHLIVTYSHALDLELCHRLLRRGFGFAGLIGSKTKWARFRSRLAALGHAPDRIAQITCPIGEPALGKHPQAIALGVAAQLLRRDAAAQAAPEQHKDMRA